MSQVFIQSAKCVNQKIENGDIDPTNEASGVKMGSQAGKFVIDAKKLMVDSDEGKKKKKCC